MKNIIFIISLLLIGVENLIALGGGAISNETGMSSKVVGHGFAFAGVADDASAVYYNPAGLTQLEGWQLQLGGSVVDLNTDHRSQSGVNEKMKNNPVAVPYFYIANSHNKWAYGVGVNSPFGLITKWADNSFSKYWATESEVLMYMVNPTLAYRVSDSLSVGGGVDFVNIYSTKLESKVFGSPDGSAILEGDGTGWGYNVAAHWKANQKHSFGLTYRSGVNVPIKGDVHLSDLNGLSAVVFGGGSYESPATTEIKLPQSVLFGYGFKPSEKLTLFLDYQFMAWNTTESTDFNYANDNPYLTHSIRRDWKNTHNAGLGVEWQTNQHVTLRSGLMAYERVVPSYTLETSLPDSSRWVLTLGSGFKFGSTTLDIAYNAIFFTPRSIANSQGSPLSDLTGNYDTMINVFSLGITQKWGGSN